MWMSRDNVQPFWLGLFVNVCENRRPFRLNPKPDLVIHSRVRRVEKRKKEKIVQDAGLRSFFFIKIGLILSNILFIWESLTFTYLAHTYYYWSLKQISLKFVVLRLTQNTRHHTIGYDSKKIRNFSISFKRNTQWYKVNNYFSLFTETSLGFE